MTERGRVRVEPGQKRVRVYLGGELVADTIRPLLVFEKPQYPAYYIPAADVRARLEATGATERSRPAPRQPARKPAPPRGGEILGTAVQAAAELAEIGLSVGARAIRRAVSRLPRP